MIKFNTVSKSYSTGVAALSDVSLEISAGEIVGIIGRSGAGKSSLLRCINLLERPTQGDVTFQGLSLMSLSDAELNKVRHQMGMIFQHYNLLNSRTVAENIALPLELQGASPTEIAAQLPSLLELVELSDKANAYPCELSGGQKQRVAIARALSTKPNVLLCDEATSALDPQTTQTILALLKKINQQLGVLIVLITHEMAVIKEICHRVILLDAGRIIESSSSIDFFLHPQTMIAKQFAESALKQSLPASIEERLHLEERADIAEIWRLVFVGDILKEPVIHSLIEQFNIHINMLQANIDTINDTMIGIMIVSANASPEALLAAKEYLTQNSIHLELLGYVDN